MILCAHKLTKGAKYIAILMKSGEPYVYGSSKGTWIFNAKKGYMNTMEKTEMNKLNSFVERIERLEEEKAALLADIREVYTELKSDGYDAKTVRKIVKIRKMNKADVEREDELLELYRDSLGC